MNGDVRLLSLARREADLALRFGKPKSSELAARRVGTIFFGLYVAPALRCEPEAAARLPLIGFDKEGESIAEAGWLSRYFPGRQFSFRGNSQVAQAGAARAGFGVALLPRYLAADDPRLAEVACQADAAARGLAPCPPGPYPGPPRPCGGRLYLRVVPPRTQTPFGALRISRSQRRRFRGDRNAEPVRTLRRPRLVRDPAADSVEDLKGF